MTQPRQHDDAGEPQIALAGHIISLTAYTRLVDAWLADHPGHPARKRRGHRSSAAARIPDMPDGWEQPYLHLLEQPEP